MKPKESKGPRRRTVQTGTESFEVLCDVCGKSTQVFKKGLFLGDVGFVYTGITHETTIPMTEMAPVFDLLGKEAFGELHKYLREKTTLWEGLDAYCPECNLIYCKDHWIMEVKYDDDFPGFYDCTYGTCPKGHRRMIDD